MPFRSETLLREARHLEASDGGRALALHATSNDLTQFFTLFFKHENKNETFLVLVFVAVIVTGAR